MKLQELVSILETSFDAGILVNESGNIHFLNSAALDFFGAPNESLQNIGINEALVFLNKETNTPLLWKEVKQSLNESITVIVKSKDDKDTLSGEARQTEIGEYTLLFIRPSSSSSNNNNLAASMVEASLDPVFTISSDGIIQMVNSAACRLFQYTQEEFVGSNISIIAGGIHEEHHDGYMENYLLTKEAKVMGKRRRLPAKRKDGCEFVIELSVVEIRGQQHLFCGFVRDLTDILASQALVTSILDAALDPLFQVNEHGIIQMVNKAATAQFGWTRDEFIGSNISMIVGPEHASQHDQYMDRYLKTGEARVMGTKRELPARRKDGSEFIIQLSLVEVKVENGDERLFCGFVHDLTEQKALMASIERERNLIAGVIDASLDPLFQVNETGIIQMVNKAASTQFGWTHDEFLGSNINMIVGGEHAARHGQYMERYLKTGEARVMGTKRELPARRKDGSEFIVELSLVEVPVDEGQERIFCGFIFDLTEQKKHLQDIQRREAFTNKIIEGSYDALFVTDKNGNITRVNTTAVKKFESSRDDLSKLSIFSLLNSNHASWLQGEVEKYLTTGIPTTTQREVEAIRPCGDAFPVAIGVSEMEGPDGEPYFAVYMHDLSERKRMLQIEAEKAAAEYLLFNMLPETIAGRLKNDPSHIAESHSFAAVLFADIVGFTSMSSMMEPHEVVSMLNDLFSMFDEVVERYDLNKVKTIGDCYMVTSVPGIVGDEEEHCRRLCHFGLDMITTLHRYNEEGHDRKLDLRVGLNCGPVVAGVVGTKRFLYDLWGDAVNLASRMESTGIPGKVQTTGHVAEMVKDDFYFEKRGIVQVKGKGEMETYFLTGRKKPYEKPRETPKRRLRLNSKEDANYIRESIRAFEATLLDVINEPDEMDRIHE